MCTPGVSRKINIMTLVRVQIEKIDAIARIGSDKLIAHLNQDTYAVNKLTCKPPLKTP